MVFFILGDLEMNEMLNSYFGSVFTKENLSDKLPEVEFEFNRYYNNTRGGSREIKEMEK